MTASTADKLREPSDAAMRAAQKIDQWSQVYCSDAWGNAELRHIASVIDAEFAPLSDAEREEALGHFKFIESRYGNLPGIHPHRWAKIHAALSRPAPGWNDACKAIAKEIEGRRLVASLSEQRLGLEQAAALARGMRKEQDSD